jgi:tRNA pseudouridine65 synthase
MDNHFTHLPWAKGVTVAHVSNGLIAVEKPAGIRSHPNPPQKIDPQALLVAPYGFEQERFMVSSNTAFYLLNRLDAPTSGLILGTFDCALNEVVRAVFVSKNVLKTYYALVKGVPAKRNGVWKNNLVKTTSNNYVRTQTRSHMQSAQSCAETRYKCMEVFNTPIGTVSLLELTPITGKTHQLRVQCASHKHPIVGDKTYGDFGFNRKFSDAFKEQRLFLHSGAIEFLFVYQKKTYTFAAKSPLPKVFTKLNKI